MRVLQGICVIFVWMSMFFTGSTLFNMAFGLSTSPHKLMLEALYMGVLFAWLYGFKMPKHDGFKRASWRKK